MNRKEKASIKKQAKAEFGVNYLLSLNSDPKTLKSNKSSNLYMTVIQYLAPARIGGWQVCSSASRGCLEGCLHTSGNPVYLANKEKARLARKRLYFENRELYAALLQIELEKYLEMADSLGLRLAVRLNGTSDIVWENVLPQIFDLPIQYYDYSKHVKRFRLDWRLPTNYDLTFSRSETNHTDCLELLSLGARCSIVFSQWRTDPIPSEFDGFPVFDGDVHDMTFSQPSGWLGLRAKGKARKDSSGFVVHAAA